MKKTLLTISTIVSSCFFVTAQNPPVVTFTPFTDFITKLQDILDRSVPLLISLAVLGLFWFLLQFVWKGSSDPKAREGSIKGMGYSLLAIFVMVAVWGIIAFIANLTGIGVGGDGGAIVPGLVK